MVLSVLNCLDKYSGTDTLKKRVNFSHADMNSLRKKESLGLWRAKNEGAKFWLSVMTELKNRILQDLFIACCDGLKGFPEAVEAVYPQTLSYVWCTRSGIHCVMLAGKSVKLWLQINNAANLEAAEHALEAFSAKWDERSFQLSASPGETTRNGCSGQAKLDTFLKDSCSYRTGDCISDR